MMSQGVAGYLHNGTQNRRLRDDAVVRIIVPVARASRSAVHYSPVRTT